MNTIDTKAAAARAAAAKMGLTVHEARRVASFDSPLYAFSAEVLDRAEAAEAPREESLTELVAWLESQTWSEFALSLARQFHERGSLSAKQVASARSMQAKMVARQAEREAQAQAEAQRTDGLDLRNVPSGHYAIPGGDTRLKVRIDNVTKGKWEGWVFVKDGAWYGERQRYGSQRPGEFYRGQIEDQLRAIAANPLEAAKEYGRLTGRCCVCNRVLEDEASVAAGIGPVCAKGF